MKRYINIKTGSLIETVDEFDTKDYASTKEFNTQIAVSIGSYRMIYKSSDVYVSSRCTKSWSDNQL